MSPRTNELVESTRRFALPTASAAALALAAGMFFHHDTHVHAASFSSPLDDSSVSSLVALDQAVEAVASRVSPAVVNVAVSARGGSHEAAEDGQNGPGGEDDEQGGNQRNQQGQLQLPPGFEQFLGNGNGNGGPRLQQLQPQGIERGIGSGVILSPDGYIVTNNHVVEGAINIKVTLNDRRVLNARVIGTDKLTDLAVIKVDATNLPSIPWGDSATLKPGQTVLAFGSPFGYFQNSVTRGIVSAVNRQNPYSQDARKPGGFIQTDAAINPGNSGGALVNAHGQLIGINAWILSSTGSFSGAGFAIPAQIAQSITSQLIKNGVVHHGYLGISMNDVTPDNASFFKLADATGAIVAQVSPNSPASRAGLASGDVITSLNGHKVLNSGELQVAVAEDTPGQAITLGILRNGAGQTVNLTVGEFNAASQQAANADSSAPEAGKPGKLGLAVSNITPDVRQQLQLPENLHGVAVESVRPASPADDAGLAPGDVILEVDRRSTSSADQFVREVHSNPADKDLLLLVWSRGNSSYRVLRPGENAKG